MSPKHLLLAVAVMGACSGVCLGDLVLTPPDRDLNDLDHSYAYTWGISQPLPPDVQVVGASLAFDNIRDWTWESNVLYIHLLNTANLGLRTLYDNRSGDYFAAQGVVLTTYVNLPPIAQDLVYNFTPDQVQTLNSYLADGVVGLAFDPDCHFYNDGVKLSLTLGSGGVIPEPATMAFLAVGGGLLALRRHRRNGRGVSAAA